MRVTERTSVTVPVSKTLSAATMEDWLENFSRMEIPRSRQISKRQVRVMPGRIFRKMWIVEKTFNDRLRM